MREHPDSPLEDSQPQDWPRQEPDLLAERIELGKRNTLSISDIDVEKGNLSEWDWEW